MRKWKNCYTVITSNIPEVVGVRLPLDERGHLHVLARLLRARVQALPQDLGGVQHLPHGRQHGLEVLGGVLADL